MLRQITLALSGAAAMCLAAPIMVRAQQVVPAPLPPLTGQAFADSDSPDQQGTAPEGSKGEKGNELDFLNKELGEISRTQVKTPSSGAMSAEVTSVSKQPSTVGRSAAAVFVITQEMIRRSGATCVPELLRMAPGVEVARINSHAWAITARGFNARFSNKLLVLIDGRQVYNELFSGVYWDVQDLLLEDIERIEVIRGPGGTIWGDNAVNGVISIITKKAQDTQGSMVSAGGGNLDKSINGLRAGGSNGEGLYWRVYGKHFERGPEYVPGGGHDDWRIGRGGFRVDWDLDRAQCNRLTVMGSYYGGEDGQKVDIPLPDAPFLLPVAEDEGVSGAYVLARFDHKINDESDWSLQAYFDRTFRNQLIATQQLTSLDVEWQHRFPLGDWHRLIWGLRYRQTHAYMPTETFYADMIPSHRTMNLFSGFVQDEMTLVEDHLFFTVGTKLENNSFTNFEYQPSARILWSPDERHVVWGAVSRAVRTPAWFEEDAVAHLGPMAWAPKPTFFEIIGSRDLLSEDAVAYEIGYRQQVTERFAWDLATFYNVYDNLIWTVPVGWDDRGAYIAVIAPDGNWYSGQTYGVEWTGHWTVTDRWRLSGSYSFLRVWVKPIPGVDDPYPAYVGNSPINQVRCYSSWDLGHRWEFDMGLRYVDELPAQNVPAYLTMDLRLGWKAADNLEVAIVGQNLFDKHHAEFGAESYGFQSAEVRRTIYASLTWYR